MKKLLIFVGMIVLLAGCTVTQSSDDIQRQQQEVILKEGTQQTGMPDIHNFFERKLMKQILEKRDNPDLTTYAYTEAMDGRFVYIGRAIGYGLPYGTEYTNPQKVTVGRNQIDSGTGNVTIPQADPNGLFSPSSANATWLLIVDEKTNESKIMYVEPNLIVTETKLPARLCEPWSLPSNY